MNIKKIIFYITFLFIIISSISSQVRASDLNFESTTNSNPLLSFLPFIIIIGIFIIIFTIIKNATKPNKITCPKCGNLCYQGGYKGWQIIIAVFGFPWGLLALLAGRKPTECNNCGFIWQG